jgi:hypothetical protein
LENCENWVKKQTSFVTFSTDCPQNKIPDIVHLTNQQLNENIFLDVGLFHRKFYNNFAEVFLNSLKLFKLFEFLLRAM